MHEIFLSPSKLTTAAAALTFLAFPSYLPPPSTFRSQSIPSCKFCLGSAFNHLRITLVIRNNSKDKRCDTLLRASHRESPYEVLGVLPMPLWVISRSLIANLLSSYIHMSIKKCSFSMPFLLVGILWFQSWFNFFFHFVISNLMNDVIYCIEVVVICPINR